MRRALARGGAALAILALGVVTVATVAVAAAAAPAPYPIAPPLPRYAHADSAFIHTLAWTPLGEGVEWTTARVLGAGALTRTQLVVARIDPARVRFALELALDRRQRPAWSIDRAPADAVLAVNAGQFIATMPWGWVVSEGRERLRPGAGPLSTAVAIDSAGRLHWIAGDSLGAPRAGIATAFQSYPTLLAHDGEVPTALQQPGRGIDLSHRDTRLAVGQTREGRVLVVLTRFDELGGALGAAPLGPTTPEMAAIMGALGARDAVMLDGGISAQLLLRDPKSRRAWRWRGWRKVPLALVVRPRAH